MKIYVTGDTHWGTGDEKKVLDLKANKDDVVIICGDAGIVWDDGKYDKEVKEQISKLPFTIIYCLGNHENYDALAKYQLVDFAGAKAHRILDNCYQIENDQFMTLNGKSFWFCGGAASTDKACRRKGIDWWEQEVPKDWQINQYYDHILTVGEVDYIITHQCPRKISKELYHGFYDYYKHDDEFLMTMFDFVTYFVDFNHWYCGHHHVDQTFDKITVLYNDIIELE